MIGKRRGTNAPAPAGAPKASRRVFLKMAAVSAAATALPATAPRAAADKPGRRPNFVVIFIDDMGYGDIGPFGAKANRTPHLDRMAAEGLKLTSFYVPSAVCTPSRAGLMTGCYPKRVGLARGSWGVVLFPKDPHGLHPDEITVAEVLRRAGYATGCFGKWHLGDQPPFLPTRHGFDTYVGIPYSNDMWPPHPAAKRWKNGVCPLPVLRGEKVEDIVKNMHDQAQLCKRFTDEAVAFIRKNKDKPFFVYLPHAFVHFPRSARDEFLKAAGIDDPGKLDEQKLVSRRDYFTAERTRAQIKEVDWSVGQILGAVRELGLGENTLVLFTSDNGGSSGCSNAPLRGGKGSAFEGSMREPTLAWWPGTVPPKTTCDEVATTMDLLPTFAALAGAKAPGDRVIDGKDISALLREPAKARSPHEAFFYYIGDTLRAVRAGAWKLHADGRLYNLETDIGERKDAARQNPEVVERLRGLLDKCRADLDNPKNCRPVGKVAHPQYLVPPIKD